MNAAAHELDVLMRRRGPPPSRGHQRGGYVIDRIEVGCSDSGEPYGIVVLQDDAGNDRNLPIPELEGARVFLKR